VGPREWLSERLSRLHQSDATRFLVLLLVIDLGFLMLDGVATFTDLLVRDRLALNRDRGYPEAFQYMKFVWLTGLMLWVAWREREPRYVFWGVLFTALGIDDAFEVHESTADFLVGPLGLAGAGNLRAVDFGELSFAIGAGIVVLALLLVVVLRSSRAFRQASLDLFVLLVLLGFFGVVLDFAAMAVDLGPVGNRFPSAAEDWGEMVTVSLMAWYAFRMAGMTPDDRLATGGLVGRSG
jgi:hypothetical protein